MIAKSLSVSMIFKVVLYALGDIVLIHRNPAASLYIYKTAGQDAIEFTAHALDVPLCRKTDGTAVEQGSEHGGRTADPSSGGQR